MRFIVPENAVTHFHLREGDAVADFGAGSGFFLPALSRVVGRSGTVYACEIQRALTERLTEFIRSEGLDNTAVVWCDLEVAGGTKLADGALDAGVLANTLFQIEDKDAALGEIARTLRSGGKLFILDWSESFAGMGPQSSDVLTKDRAQELAAAHGFSFEREFPAGEHHYGLAFRRS